MLSKLLKYEFRATGRIMLPVYALLLVTAGGTSVTGSLMGRYPESTVLSIFRTLFMTLFAFTTFGVLLLTLVLMVYRFYKNLMTDEGYLMFTLPVSRSLLIWSKLIVSMAGHPVGSAGGADVDHGAVRDGRREPVRRHIPGAAVPDGVPERQRHRMHRGPGGAASGRRAGVVSAVLCRHLPGPQLLQPQAPAVGGVLHRLRHRRVDHSVRGHRRRHTH